MSFWDIFAPKPRRLPPFVPAPSYPWPTPSEREMDLRKENASLLRTIQNLEAVNEAVCNERDEAKDEAAIYRITASRAEEFDHRLNLIIALEIARASHSLKKAVAIARGEK